MKGENRWLYIKNGDVVEQLKLLGDCPKSFPEGGTEAFIGDFLHYTIGDQVFLLSCFNRKARYKKGRVDALVVKTEGGLNRSPFVKFFMLILQFYIVFFRMVIYRPNRIICGQSGPMLWFSYILSKLFNAPWIHSRHNRVTNPRASIHSILKEAIDRYCIHRAQAVICHGPYLKRQLLDIGVNIERIYEFDVGFSDFLKQANSLPGGSCKLSQTSTPFVLYVGRMERCKGIFDILNAQEARLKHHAGIGLVYAGGGSDLKRLVGEVTRKGLTQKVAILGKVNRNHLPATIKAAKIMIVATRTDFPEGRCMAAMEGLALGIPVVAPDFGPFPYLIEDKVNGLLYQPNSVEDLKIKLDSLLNNDIFYQQVAKDTRETAYKIINPPLTFSQAIQKAFRNMKYLTRTSRNQTSLREKK